MQYDKYTMIKITEKMKKQISDFANKNYDGNESMAVRQILKKFFDFKGIIDEDD